MKANFALSLSSDGIRLLHRAAGGWKGIGEVSLEDPDFPTTLTTLRETAQTLEPAGLRTKLIIPSGQIKYLTLETPNADDQARRDAARHALDGATPYAVSELAFDVSPDGDLTHVAAVAQETLAEAESFAANFGFVPISAVAVPGTAAFLGEPFFGATDFAASILENGAKVEPDQIAVVEIDPSLDSAPPVVDMVIEDPMPTAADDDGTAHGTGAPELETNTTSAKSTTRSWVPAAPATDQDVEPFDDTDYAEINSADVALTTSTDKTDLIGVSGNADPEADADATFGFATRRTNTPDAALDIDASARPETARINLNVVSGELAGTNDDDLDKDAAAGPAGFASRRLPATPRAPKAPTVSPTDRLFASRFKRTSLEKPIVALPRSEQQRMTVFGARKPDARAIKAGGSRFVGLTLVAILLLGLVGVAAWATVFREDGLASFFSAPQVDDTAITLDELTPVPEPDPIVNEVQTASLDTTPPEPTSEALAQPEPDIFDPDAAEAHYAVTGIWAIPPNVPQAPALLGLDDLYITSIDGSNLSFDAVALIPTADLETDIAFRAPSSPAPSGTQFSLDARGLVIPTAQGAVSPEGVIVFLGKPISVPPATPDRSARTPVEPDIRSELVASRPKARPAALVENTERTQLGGLSRAELAAIRPKIRPQTEKQKAEEDETPTAQAAVISKRPSGRPRGFDNVVAKARQTPTRPTPAAPATNVAPDEAPDEAPRRVAALAPRTVTPSVPSSATTAKQATIRRAINLNRINLMGVYGTQSNRRALVRLSNGRYKKVQVGDRIDGGKVSAIGEGELRYQKGSRNIVLKMPKT